MERKFWDEPKDTICAPLERLVEGRGPALGLSVVVEGIFRVPIPSSSERIRVGHVGTIIQMKGAAVSARLENGARGIVVFAIVIVVVVGAVVVIPIVIVTERV